MEDDQAGGKYKSPGGGQAAIPPRTGRFGDDKDPNLGKDYQFKPGQSGNPAGGKKGQKLLSTQIREMMDDPKFIDRLSEKIKDKMELPDEEFQGTPMKAIITVAMLEAMDPARQAGDRDKARDWLAKFGYGSKVDITSDGQRIAESPKVISVINPRQDDAPAETEAS